MTQVFISYSREDQEFADRLYGELKDEGLEPWMDRTNILPGEHWKASILKAIGDSVYTVVLMSQRSLTKAGTFQWELRKLKDELYTLPEKSRFLIPARIDDCVPSELTLESLAPVDLFPNFSAGVEHILQIIRGSTGLPDNVVPGPAKSLTIPRFARIQCPECEASILWKARDCPSCGLARSLDQQKLRLGVPAIPQEIYNGLRKAALHDCEFLTWEVEEGDSVKKGQVLARYHVHSFRAFHSSQKKIRTRAVITAPATGQIETIRRHESFNWDFSSAESLYTNAVQWSDEAPTPPQLHRENILFFMVTPSQNRYKTAYASYESIVDYGYFARPGADTHIFLNPQNLFRKSRFKENDFPVYFLEALASSSLFVEELDWTYIRRTL